MTKRVKEDEAWGDLRKKIAGVDPKMMSVEGLEIDITQPCIVLGGWNGAGKTRALRALASSLGKQGLYLDLHHLSEQALIILRSRDDFSEMTTEVDPVGPNPSRKNDTERVVARHYDSIKWFSLEVEPDDEKVAEQFRWGGSTSLIPYFEVEHKGRTFSSRDMGLGEFSIHFLFWVLEQYRDEKGLVLLLDEPDAYLPPIGSSSLLVRLLRLCLERDWTMMISTHSTEMIQRALEQDAFVLLRLNDSGDIEATHSKNDAGAADTLMTPAPIRNILFVEDESAWALCTILMEAADRRLPPISSVIWGKGASYMEELQEHFPRTPASTFWYSYVFDGDQRKLVKKSKSGRWPAIFLPTSEDPDDLFKSNGQNTEELARRLNVPEQELVLFLDSTQGIDRHDWVNDLAAKYGRPRTLRVLAEMWVENHPAESKAWYEELINALK